MIRVNAEANVIAQDEFDFATDVDLVRLGQSRVYPSWLSIRRHDGRT